MSEPKLVPTNEEGKEVELNEETKLMNLSKKELVELIQNNETKHKRALSRAQNLKKEMEKMEDELNDAKQFNAKLQDESEQTMEEAAKMSETIRIKNRILNEVVDAYLNLTNIVTATSTQGLKILEYNGLVSNPGNERSKK